MKEIFPKIENETYDEQRQAGRYNPASVAIYKGSRFTLDAGSDDSVSFFVDHDRLLVVSSNHRLDYAGLQVFYLSGDYAGQEMGSVFCQNESELKEMIGKKGIDYTDRTIAKRLDQYIG